MSWVCHYDYCGEFFNHRITCLVIGLHFVIGLLFPKRQQNYCIFKIVAYLFLAAGPKAKAKAKTLAERTHAWKKLDFEAESKGEKEEGEEEEGCFENDEEIEPDEKSKSKDKANEKRHFGKARKFQRMLKAGQIPEDILKLYNDGAMQQKQPRLFRTELINKLFQQDSKGEYCLRSDSPSFQAWKKNVDKVWASQQTGVPSMVILWQVFQGNEAAMNRAEALGQIFEKDGMYHHAETLTGGSKSSADQMDLQGGSVALEVSAFAGMSSFFGKRDWAKYGQEAVEDSQPALKKGKNVLCMHLVGAWHLLLTRLCPLHSQKLSSFLGKCWRRQLGMQRGPMRGCSETAADW